MRRCLVLVAVLVSASAIVSLDGCAHARNDAAPDGSSTADAGSRDGRKDDDEAAADAQTEAERDRGALSRLAAANFQVSVLDRPAWPESNTGAKRLGYLRSGAVVAAYEKSLTNDECKDGWYELASGGFVCGKAITLELTSARIRLAPKGPDRDAGMPYRYGVNLLDGTPLYRRVLATDDRKKYEPWLAPPKEDPAPEDKGPVATASDPEPKEAPPEEEGAPGRHPTKEKDKDLDGGKDAGKPKLKELRGRGVLVRKMAKGFYLALDRDFRAANAHWWRTTFGFATPFDRIMLQHGVTKHVGEWWLAPKAVAGPIVLDVEAGAPDGGDASITSGTVGFISIGSAHEVEVDEDGKKAGWGKEISKRSSVLFTGKSVTVNGTTYHQTANGFYLRAADVRLAKPAPPADLGPDEKWIDVDLTRQALVAFEGMRPVFATVVSSGRRNPQDKEKDFPTPAGSFKIREKHVTTTMDGDVASDGPYSIEDVPWVMYFQGSYALHGAFWHDAFGWPRSHGCVNMAPEDARTLFAWTDPQLPDGWHGVFATDERQGTRIVVHEDPVHRHRRASVAP